MSIKLLAKSNLGIWIAVVIILPSILLISASEHHLPSQLKAHFSFLMTTDYWQSLLIKPILFLVLLMMMEALVVGWDKCSIKRLINPSRSSRVDIATFLLGIFRLTPLFEIIFTLGIALLIRKVLPSLPTLGINNQLDNLIIQGAIWVIGKDFVTYWIHRLSHRVGFLWEAHKFHHSATEFNILSLNRLHPIDLAYRSVSRGILLGLLGIPLQAFPILLLFERTLDRINHSNLTWRYGWIGRWVIYSPHGHRIHHSSDPVHFDKNFGETSPVWDRLFGTWSNEQKKSEEIEIGIPNNIYNKHSFFYDYWLCFANTMTALGKTFSTRKPGSIE